MEKHFMTNTTSHLKFQNISASQINIGDTVLIDGKMQTIGKNNIKFCNFFGYRLNGARTEEVTRVLFPKWFKGEIVNWQARI
jgi:hypothetical protein